MSQAIKLAAALGLAGTMLASSPASHAQNLRTVPYAYAAGAYGDCYYDPSQICPPGPYAAVRTVGPFGAYAAINGTVQPSYLGTEPFFFRGLRGGDWVAIHGSGGTR